MAEAAGKADRLSYHGCALCMTMRADTGGWTQFKPSIISPVGTAGLHYLRHRCQSSRSSSFPALWSWQLPSPGLRVVIVAMATLGVPTLRHSASATIW